MECSRRSDARTECPRRAEESLAGPRVAGRAAGTKAPAPEARGSAVPAMTTLPSNHHTGNGARAVSQGPRYPSRRMPARRERADRCNRTSSCPRRGPVAAQDETGVSRWPLRSDAMGVHYFAAIDGDWADDAESLAEALR